MILADLCWHVWHAVQDEVFLEVDVRLVAAEDVLELIIVEVAVDVLIAIVVHSALSALLWSVYQSLLVISGSSSSSVAMCAGPRERGGEFGGSRHIKNMRRVDLAGCVDVCVLPDLLISSHATCSILLAARRLLAHWHLDVLVAVPFLINIAQFFLIKARNVALRVFLGFCLRFL